MIYWELPLTKTITAITIAAFALLFGSYFFEEVCCFWYNLTHHFLITQICIFNFTHYLRFQLTGYKSILESILTFWMDYCYIHTTHFSLLELAFLNQFWLIIYDSFLHGYNIWSNMNCTYSTHHFEDSTQLSDSNLLISFNSLWLSFPILILLLLHPFKSSFYWYLLSFLWSNLTHHWW